MIVKEPAIQLYYGKKLSRKLTGTYLITKLNNSVVTALYWKTQRKVKGNLDRVYLYTGRINKRMRLLQKSQLGIEVEEGSPTQERDISETDESQNSDSLGEYSETDQNDCVFEKR